MTADRNFPSPNPWHLARLELDHALQAADNDQARYHIREAAQHLEALRAWCE